MHISNCNIKKIKIKIKRTENKKCPQKSFKTLTIVEKV